jgi:hypothetical protein
VGGESRFLGQKIEEGTPPMNSKIVVVDIESNENSLLESVPWIIFYNTVYVCGCSGHFFFFFCCNNMITHTTNLCNIDFYVVW